MGYESTKSVQNRPVHIHILHRQEHVQYEHKHSSYSNKDWLCGAKAAEIYISYRKIRLYFANKIQFLLPSKQSSEQLPKSNGVCGKIGIKCVRMFPIVFFFSFLNKFKKKEVLWPAWRTHNGSPYTTSSYAAQNMQNWNFSPGPISAL